MIEDPQGRYRQLLAERPDLFVSDPKGVRIVTDPEGLAAVESEMSRRMEAEGHPAWWGRAGLYYEDPWIWILRDAVIFPDGRPGLYHRLICHSPDTEITGIIVLPVIGDEVVLIRHYRHPCGEWCWEAPRGGITPGLSPIETAHEELEEEIGAKVESLIPIGSVLSNSGLVRGRSMLFLGKLAALGLPQTAEGIIETHRVSVTQLETMIVDGSFEDVFAIAAFTQARLRGLL